MRLPFLEHPDPQFISLPADSFEVSDLSTCLRVPLCRSACHEAQWKSPAGSLDRLSAGPLPVFACHQGIVEVLLAGSAEGNESHRASTTWRRSSVLSGQCGQAAAKIRAMLSGVHTCMPDQLHAPEA